MKKTIKRKIKINSVKKRRNTKVADNYKERVKVIIKRLLSEIEAMTGKPQQNISENMFEAMALEFHKFLNSLSQSYQKYGFSAPHYSGPLTESEMQFVEGRILGSKTFIIRDDESDTFIAWRTNNSK